MQLVCLRQRVPSYGGCEVVPLRLLWHQASLPFSKGRAPLTTLKWYDQQCHPEKFRTGPGIYSVVRKIVGKERGRNCCRDPFRLRICMLNQYRRNRREEKPHEGTKNHKDTMKKQELLQLNEGGTASFFKCALSKLSLYSYSCYFCLYFPKIPGRHPLF